MTLKAYVNKSKNVLIDAREWCTLVRPNKAETRGGGGG